MRDPRRDLVPVERPESEENVREGVRVADLLVQASELALEVREDVQRDELADLVVPQDLAEEAPVERERLRSPLGAGRTGSLEESEHVLARERQGEGRGRSGRDLDQARGAFLEVVEE